MLKSILCPVNKRILSSFIAVSLLASLFSFTALPVTAKAASEAPTGYWTDYASEPALDSSTNTYNISTAAGLAWLAKAASSGNTFDGYTVKLSANIDLSAHFWVPIGAREKEFHGNFDGCNFTISGLRIGTAENPDARFVNVGLFGVTSTAVFSNISLKDVAIYCTDAMGMTGGPVVGGLVSYGTDNSSITNCSVSGIVSCSNNYAKGTCVGGLFGLFEGKVTRSWSSCSVKTGPFSCCGGLGGDFKGAVTQCFSSGSVTGGDATTVGGLLGSITSVTTTHSTVKSSFATGDVTCGSEKMGTGSDGSTALQICLAGGLAGYVIRSDFHNCYATGSVTGGKLDANNDGTAESYVAAIAAGVDPNAEWIYIYWNIDSAIKGGVIGSNTGVIGNNTAYGDIFGAQRWPTAPQNTAFMKRQEFADLLEAYDTCKTSWKLYPGYNNGYPMIVGVGTPVLTDKTAVPTASAVLINDVKVAFEAYNIEGYNYFKLRDLAAALSGSAKQFEVGWDNAKNAISITTGKKYTPVGGELSLSGNTLSVNASPSTATVYLNGVSISLIAYSIGGYNYFKLRDLAGALSFGVGYDDKTQTITIDTSKAYTA